MDSDTWNKTSTYKHKTSSEKVMRHFYKILSCLSTSGGDTEIRNTVTNLFIFLPGNITPKATEPNYNL